MHARTIRRGIRLAANLATITMHGFADQWVQDSESAQNKGQNNEYGRRCCQKHVAGYTATLATAQATTNAALGIHTRPGPFLLGHAATGLAHYVMDRSRDTATLPRQLQKLPGMPEKLGYWNHGGQYELDQAWHWACLGAWAVADAVLAER